MWHLQQLQIQGASDLLQPGSRAFIDQHASHHFTFFFDGGGKRFFFQMGKSNGILPQPFNWQDGFGVFSYSKSAVPTVAKYIHNQPIHHQNVPFREEYPTMLTENGVEFDPKYLFEFYD